MKKTFFSPKKILQVDMKLHRQLFDELDRIFAMQLKKINQYIIKDQQQQVNVNHEYPK